MVTSSDRAALLVVDLQAGVVEGVYRREATLATIMELVDRARLAGVPVVWTRQQDEGNLVKGGARWRIVSEPSPAPGELIVDKQYGDAFAQTDLEAHLRRLGAGRIILCGVESDACIRSTLNGAVYRGIDVTLVEDAHTTSDRRAFGVTFAPEQAIDMVNLMASYTILPEARATLSSAGEVFPEHGE